MNVTNDTSYSNSIRWQETQKQAESKNDQLTQEDFFALLTQQLSYQDPFKPVENENMIAQMASFTTADGINNMNKKFEDLTNVMTSSQALQASSLVGQRVLTPNNDTFIDKSGAYYGVVEADQSIQSLAVTVVDSKGQVVNKYELGDQAAGKIRFGWDGKDFDGNELPPGVYSFKASGLSGGEGKELPAFSYAHVESVTLGSNGNGVRLNLRGLGELELGQVLEVAQGA